MSKLLDDAVSVIKNLLNSNWDSSNTDNVTPQIEAIYDVKRVSGLTANSDVVLIYQGQTIIDYNSLGWMSRKSSTGVSIDVRGTYSRSRTIKMLKEVDRIMKLNRKSPGGNFDLLKFVRVTDLCDRTKKLWRFVYDVDLLVKSEVI